MNATKQNVLNSNAPIHTVAGTRYKGSNPEYQAVRNEDGNITGYNKVKKGVPYVKIGG